MQMQSIWYTFTSFEMKRTLWQLVVVEKHQHISIRRFRIIFQSPKQATIIFTPIWTKQKSMRRW